MSMKEKELEATLPEDEEGSPAWRRAVLRILEKWGRLAKSGNHVMDPDGVRRPIYIVVDESRDLERDYADAMMQHSLDGLERMGLIRKTGEHRPDEDGVLHPSYAPVCEG